jgi:hypothetical protein
MSAVAGLLALGLATGACAQEKQLYKYIDADGRVVYTDKQPPASAKNVQPKRLQANVIETNETPLAARMASDRYPVTLYTFDCGEVCQNAEALLNRRGVPFSTVNVADPQGAAKLQALTGANAAPVLQVGDKLVSTGLNESRWQAMLDEAGYPKTPPPRRVAPGASTAGKAADTRTRTETPPPPPAPAPVSDGGYPKN